MLRYITLLDPSFDLEQFIQDTFESFSGDNGLGHIEGQRDYLSGVFDTLCRIGKINEQTHAFLRFVFIHGEEIELAEKRALEMVAKKEGLVDSMMILPDLGLPPINPLPPDEEMGNV
jgi:hypothetical protein